MGVDSGIITGTVDLLILKVVSLEPMHGWGITQRIQSMSGETLSVQQGSLYASFRRLTREGWLSSSWQDTEHGRRARYYALTPAGRVQLEAQIGRWTRLAGGVLRIIEATA